MRLPISIDLSPSLWASSKSSCTWDLPYCWRLWLREINLLELWPPCLNEPVVSFFDFLMNDASLISGKFMLSWLWFWFLTSPIVTWSSSLVYPRSTGFISDLYSISPFLNFPSCTSPSAFSGSSAIFSPSSSIELSSFNSFEDFFCVFLLYLLLLFC